MPTKEIIELTSTNTANNTDLLMMRQGVEDKNVEVQHIRNLGTNAGQSMPVGAFGIGGDAIAPPSNNANLITQNGLYAAASTTNTPFDGELIHNQRSVSEASQYLVDVNEILWIRKRTASTWGDWKLQNSEKSLDIAVLFGSNDANLITKNGTYIANNTTNAPYNGELIHNQVSPTEASQYLTASDGFLWGRKKTASIWGEWGFYQGDKPLDIAAVFGSNNADVITRSGTYVADSTANTPKSKGFILHQHNGELRFQYFSATIDADPTFNLYVRKRHETAPGIFIWTPWRRALLDADQVISEANIQNGAVTADKIPDSSIPLSKLSSEYYNAFEVGTYIFATDIAIDGYGPGTVRAAAALMTSNAGGVVGVPLNISTPGSQWRCMGSVVSSGSAEERTTLFLRIS